LLREQGGIGIVIGVLVTNKRAIGSIHGVTTPLVWSLQSVTEWSGARLRTSDRAEKLFTAKETASLVKWYRNKGKYFAREFGRMLSSRQPWVDIERLRRNGGFSRAAFFITYTSVPIAHIRKVCDVPACLLIYTFIFE